MKRLGIMLLVGTLALLAMPGIGHAEDKGDITDRWMAGKRTAWVLQGGKKPGSVSAVECTATGDPAANVNLDCDDPYPNNEPDIEADPADPLHMIASSNDYGTCCDEFYTTFDAGKTWTTGNMSNEGPTVIGSDPVTVFDVKHGTAIHTSLNFTANAKYACAGDFVASISEDGGLTWLAPVVIMQGMGCDIAPTQLFNDKPWIVVDNNPASPHFGTAYATWTLFVSHKGAYASSAIYEAHSTDGGYTWSTPQAISGRNGNLCTYQEDGVFDGSCDEDQFSVPTVAPGGTVYVAFQNSQNQALWERHEQFDDQYLVVKSSDGGRTWSTPRFVVGLEDGTRDYPLNVDDRQTLSGYQVRVNSAGNIVADPNDGTLYLTFADNRAGTHDVNHPVTNANVYLMTSTNGGSSWSGPMLAKSSPTDQWFPWAEVNPTNGDVGIVYNDRSTSNPAVYDATFSVWNGGGFSTSVVSTASSHPKRSEFFQADVPNCEQCATFHGDYINVSYGSDGKANLTWTDMRDFDPDADAYQQFIYFARR
jgi:hypothetical protein